MPLPRWARCNSLDRAPRSGVDDRWGDSLEFPSRFGAHWGHDPVPLLVRRCAGYNRNVPSAWQGWLLDREQYCSSIMNLRKQASRPTLVVVGVFLALSLAGCVAPQDEAVAINDAWEPQLRELQRTITAEFPSQVLEDLVISPAEYEEATNRYVGCMQDQGIDAAKVPEGDFYGFSLPTSPTAEAVEADCYLKFMDGIAGMYVSITTNPANEDFFALMAECLVRSGVVGPDFDADAYLALEPGTPAAGTLTLDSPEVTACRLDPSQ